MKKLSFLLFAFLIFQTFKGITQPVISGVVSPNIVAKYEKYEVDFNLNLYSNPYDPTIVDVYAEFWSPSGQHFKQNAFFYEGYNKLDNGSTENTPENLSPNGLNN